jgi:hypothetical protein
LAALTCNYTCLLLTSKQVTNGNRPICFLSDQGAKVSITFAAVDGVFLDRHLFTILHHKKFRLWVLLTITKVTNRKSHICCLAAQGAKVSITFAALDGDFLDSHLFTILHHKKFRLWVLLPSKPVTNRNSPICCLATQGAKVSITFVAVIGVFSR